MEQEREPANAGEMQGRADRDPKTGQFLPGRSGNPAGKVEGTKNFTTKVREALLKLADESDPDSPTVEYLLIQRIIKMAVEQGNEQMIKLMWNYLDGMPTQKNVLEHHVGDKTLEDLLDEDEEMLNQETDEENTRPTAADNQPAADTQQARPDSEIQAEPGADVVLEPQDAPQPDTESAAKGAK